MWETRATVVSSVHTADNDVCPYAGNIYTVKKSVTLHVLIKIGLTRNNNL